MKFTLFILFWLLAVRLCAQIPPGYYNTANGLHGADLQEALHEIIKDHHVVTYNNIWSFFEQTDKKPNGKVWDIYSDVPGGTPPYVYNFVTDQCGNYSQEGDCYNREHSFPSSWFGGNNLPMYTDMHHIFPTDGFVNNKRDNYPYGEASSASWTSMNGSRLGNSSVVGYNGVVFEPIDAYKGDLARMHFYMATRYLGEDGNWEGSPSVDGAQLKEWALIMLYQWHLDDPVSQKEIDRNNAIFQIQQNRNPFVDHPEFAELIWYYTNSAEDFILPQSQFGIFPNPAGDVVNIKAKYELSVSDYSVLMTDMSGRAVSEKINLREQNTTLDISGLSGGFYFVSIFSSEIQPIETFKLIIK
jgi:endonuclease I